MAQPRVPRPICVWCGQPHDTDLLLCPKCEEDARRSRESRRRG
jgi:predicted amidophosphoribosyltransferase